MKTPFAARLFTCAAAFALCAAAAHAQTTPKKMKMTTPIPLSITTPNSVATRIGTLKFFDGFPDDDTVLLPASLRLSEVHFDRA